MLPTRAMKTIRKPAMTPFGRWLILHSISHGYAAEVLGVTKAYVSMLASGAATPHMVLAATIEVWTGGEVSMISWVPWFQSHGKRRRARRAA